MVLGEVDIFYDVLGCRDKIGPLQIRLWAPLELHL